MKLTYRYSLTLIVLILNAEIVCGQYKIYGKVLDENKEPLEDVSVFLNNTSFSANTVVDGTYSLEVSKGDHEIVIYKYGYSPVSYPLVIVQSQELNVELEPLNVKLVQQEVTADRDPIWFRYLKLFETDFLGESKNGRGCDFLNPKTMILDGNQSLATLKGWANEPLKIRNKFLGYDISYVLEAYERNDRWSSYLGYVHYKNISTLKPKHHKARKKAYLGSATHFIHALIAGKVLEEGYELYRLVQKNNNQWVNEYADYRELLSHQEDGIYLKGAGKYRLVYVKERPEQAYLRAHVKFRDFQMENFQVSELEFLENKVKLLPSGVMDPPLGILFKGYMGWEKVGDSLPLDYYPEP